MTLATATEDYMVVRYAEIEQARREQDYEKRDYLVRELMKDVLQFFVENPKLPRSEVLRLSKWAVAYLTFG